MLKSSSTSKGFIDPKIPGFEPVSFTSRNWVLLSPLTYVTEYGCKIVVPAGFVTDFASIPKVVWNLPGFDPYGDAKFPAVVHDYLYSLRGANLPDGTAGFNRSACDGVLLAALKSVGEMWNVRWTIYWAVRLFGGIDSRATPWKK